MAVSLANAGRGRAGPLCAICLDRTSGPTTRLSLGYRVSVWLCRGHSSDAFRRRGGGREFVHSLQQIWAASDALTRERRTALRRYLERVRRAAAPADTRPGSYAWPADRRETDARLAAGETLAVIEADVRRRYAASGARPPSSRTFRRWQADPRSPRCSDAAPRRPASKGLLARVRELAAGRPLRHQPTPGHGRRQPDERPAIRAVSPAAPPSLRSPPEPPARAGP